MKVSEKLAIMQEVRERNEARIRAFIGECSDVKSLASALEIHAGAVNGSLEILSDHFGVPKVALFDQLTDTVRAIIQPVQE